VSWETRPVSYSRQAAAVSGIRRVGGTARRGEHVIPWRLILKEARAWPADLTQWVIQTFQLSPAELAQIEEVWNWEREPLAFASLLDALPGDVRAPRCYGITPRDDGTRWIWLEDVGGADPDRWSTADFARAARALGTFNGAYLAGHPLPRETWLNHRFLPVWCTLTPRVVTRQRRDPETWQDPAVRRALSTETVERIERLWADYPALLARHAELPRTFCHQDSNRANLMLGHGAREVIGVDWTYCGSGAIGEDAGQLLASSLLWNDADVDAAPDLEGAIVESYLDGLRAAGWTGEGRVAWLGVALEAVLRWAMHAPRLYGAAGTIYDFVSTPDDGRSIDEIIAQRAAVTSYLLDLADRLRASLDA
jgi:hypothetical protein